VRLQFRDSDRRAGSSSFALPTSCHKLASDQFLISFGNANRRQRFPALWAITIIQNYLYFLEISAHTSVSKSSEVMVLVAGDHTKFLLHCDLLFPPSVCPTAACALAEESKPNWMN
jgi:hypothetical protein